MPFYFKTRCVKENPIPYRGKLNLPIFLFNVGLLSLIYIKRFFNSFGKKEGHGFSRTIKESIYIRVNNTTLSKNIGKFNLPHIWDRVLLNTSGLKIKSHVQGIWHAQSNQPNTPMQFFTGSMAHTQRTPLSEHALKTS